MYSREEVLIKHLKIPELKRKRIDKLIDLVNAALADKSNYSFEVFSNHDILVAQAQFQKEVIEKWGATAEYQYFFDRLSKHAERENTDKWNYLIAQSQSLFERLAEYVSLSPSLPKVQELVQEWQEYISENFYPCSSEMLSYLGELYISEDRFSTYIDRFGNGLSVFFSKAIQYYCMNKYT